MTLTPIQQMVTMNLTPSTLMEPGAFILEVGLAALWGEQTLEVRTPLL